MKTKMKNIINKLFYNNNITVNNDVQLEENTPFELLFQKNNIIYNDDLNSYKEHIYYLCLSCGEILRSIEDINLHIQKESHYIDINLTDISIWCL